MNFLSQVSPRVVTKNYTLHEGLNLLESTKLSNYRHPLQSNLCLLLLEMDTPSAREFLSKSKLAGLLRQLLSYGVKLPDLSSLAPVSNATAAVLLDITKSTSAQFSLQLSGLRAFGEADVEQTCIISQ